MQSISGVVSQPQTIGNLRAVPLRLSMNEGAVEVILGRDSLHLRTAS